MTSLKENLIKTIEKAGWCINQESIDEIIAEKSNLSSSELIKKCLNSDLRNIGAKCLPEGVLTGKLDKLEANNVLQIVKIRNIAAPKENENSQAAPPLYKITLTDGTSNVNALTLEDVNKLNTHTPPGTKVYLHGPIKIKSSLLILNPKACEVLGGNVEHLIQKWKQSKELQELQHMRGMNLTHSAPPVWVPFGTRQGQVVQVDTSKKVFSQNEKQEEDGASEFSQARQAALAEAMEAKSKVTKTFTQQTVDKSQIPATTIEARPNSSSSSTYYGSSAKSSNPTQNKEQKGKRGKGRKNMDFDNEDDYKEVKDAPKPSSVTLFDLFKTKLDIKEDDKEEVPKFNNTEAPAESYRGNRQNKFSRSNNNRDGNPPTFRQRQQQQQYGQKNDTNKQAFNLNDFNYELGDTTDPKKIPPPSSQTSQPPKTATQFTTKVSQRETHNEERMFQQKIQPVKNQQSFQSNDKQFSNERNNYKQNQKSFDQSNNQNQSQKSFNQDYKLPSQNQQGPSRQNSKHNQPQQQQYYSNDRYNSNQQNQPPFYQNDRYYQNQNQQQFYNQNDMYNQNQQHLYANNNIHQPQFYQNDGYNFNTAQQQQQQQPFYQNNSNQGQYRQKGNRN